MPGSPYEGLTVEEWAATTERIIDEHPLKRSEIVEIVLSSWEDIFESQIGSKGFKIGGDIFPQPQIMAFLLHELIPLEVTARHPGAWRRDQSGFDKDLVCLADETFSTEIKTSSSATGIFGNRSYAQVTAGNKKSKSGYYLAVNFAAFEQESKDRPGVRLIRFGWLDHSDWKGQAAESGQAAYPSIEARKRKLITLFSRSK